LGGRFFWASVCDIFGRACVPLSSRTFQVISTH
jgi:hypothetical protein